MYIRYTCPQGALLPHSEDDVIRIDVEKQLPLLETFFGRSMEPEDQVRLIDIFRRGLEEDFGVVVDGALIARAAVVHLPSGVSEIVAVTTRPPFRNRGYAKQIVGRCAASLHAQGKDAMGITTADNAAMRAVFETLGFTGTEIAEEDLPKPE